MQWSGLLYNHPHDPNGLSQTCTWNSAMGKHWGWPTINFEANSNGINKYYPHRPTCFYDGKEIATYIMCSENGSITTEILADIMHYLNEELTFDRDDATPYLLLDGHGSHFRLPFLEYINDDQHKWTVCIGVPYGTNLWQVGDSSQQNGAFKIALKKAKQYVIEQKTKLQYPCKIEKHNIVGLDHRAWNESFTQLESNRTAISERGWGPLTYNLLDHNELKWAKKNKAVQIAYEQSVLSGATPRDPNELNLSQGLARTIMD